jgi:hypothetical protein
MTTATVSTLEDCVNSSVLRNLYYNLNNYDQLEQQTKHDVKNQCRTFLSLLLEQVVPAEVKKLDIGSTVNLEQFCKDNYQKACHRYENALENGTNPYEDVHEHLLQQAPSKLIDGLWLSRVSNIENTHEIDSAAFTTAKATLEEIFYEEDGEGDEEKNHIRIYRQLLDQAGIDLPPTSSLEFSTNKRIQTSSFFSPVIQLSISILQEEFFYELCGFTLNFEELPLSLLLMRDALIREKLNDYYLLHITIDNPCSGHTYKARQVIEQLLASHTLGQGVFGTDNSAWKRIFNGYVLASFMTTKPVLDHLRQCSPGSTAVTVAKVDGVGKAAEPTVQNRSDSIESRMIEVIEKYAPYAACPMHRKIKMKGEPINDAFARKPEDFLKQMQQSGWVKPGCAEKSPLVQSFAFGKKMYKVFSDEDQQVIKDWINSLPTKETRRSTKESVVHSRPKYLVLLLCFFMLVNIATSSFVVAW